MIELDWKAEEASIERVVGLDEFAEQAERGLRLIQGGLVDSGARVMELAIERARKAHGEIMTLTGGDAA